MYLLDTPGVLPPKIESVETGMKLALCGMQIFFPPNIIIVSLCIYDKISWISCLYRMIWKSVFLQELYWTI